MQGVLRWLLAVLVAVAVSEAGAGSQLSVHDILQWQSQLPGAPGQAVTERYGETCSLNDAALGPLYEDNLFPDLDAWRSEPLRMAHFEALLQQVPPSDTIHVILIRANKIYFPLQRTTLTECERPCNKYMHQLLKAMHKWTASAALGQPPVQPPPSASGTAAEQKIRANPGTTPELEGLHNASSEHWRGILTHEAEQGGIYWPDGLYMVNVGDWPKCGQPDDKQRRCSAPALSFNKRTKDAAGQKGVGLDILIPVPPERLGKPSPMTTTGRRTRALQQANASSSSSSSSSSSGGDGDSMVSVAQAGGGSSRRSMPGSLAAQRGLKAKAGRTRGSKDKQGPSVASPASGDPPSSAGAPSVRKVHPAVLSGTHVKLYSFPWQDKALRAFWRGSGYCTGYTHAFVECSRVYFTNLTLHPAALEVLGAPWSTAAPSGKRGSSNRQARGTSGGAPGSAQSSRAGSSASSSRGGGGGRATGGELGLVLDVGLAGGRPPRASRKGSRRGGRQAWETKEGHYPRLPSVSIGDHARYKFLLHLDGITASYRLSKLLATDSPVVRQHGPYGEYFDRSLREGEHFLYFLREGPLDVFDVLSRYWDGSRDQELQQLAHNAQRFASRYLCPRARMLYLRAALAGYRSLFHDMDQEIESKWWPMVQEKMQKLGNRAEEG